MPEGVEWSHPSEMTHENQQKFRRRTRAQERLFPSIAGRNSHRHRRLCRFYAQAKERRLGSIWRRWSPGRSLTIDTSQPTVVNKIQRLQRLETVNLLA